MLYIYLTLTINYIIKKKIKLIWVTFFSKVFNFRSLMGLLFFHHGYYKLWHTNTLHCYIRPSSVNIINQSIKMLFLHWVIIVQSSYKISIIFRPNNYYEISHNINFSDSKYIFKKLVLTWLIAHLLDLISHIFMINIHYVEIIFLWHVATFFHNAILVSKKFYFVKFPLHMSFDDCYIYI